MIGADTSSMACGGRYAPVYAGRLYWNNEVVPKLVAIVFLDSCPTGYAVKKKNVLENIALLVAKAIYTTPFIHIYFLFFIR